MNSTATVIALIACHNRRDRTVEALDALFSQSSDVKIRAVLVDDGSTDGTREAVEALPWPVEVVSGTGALYWAAAMAIAERTALRHNPDYLLWLNDDTVMDGDALERMLQVSSDQGHDAIIVGATRDPTSGAVTYGGRIRVSSWHPQRLALLPLADRPQRADTFNGNLLLIPRSVRQRVGPIDGVFPHAYADDDYGLRARRVGVDVIQAPGSLARCHRVVPREDAHQGWRARQHEKGLPLGAQIRFLKRHGGAAWPIVLAAQQAKWVLESLTRFSDVRREGKSP